MLPSCLSSVASYLPCTPWLFPDSEVQQPILQPPVQTLEECLIPPAPVGLYSGAETRRNAFSTDAESWDPATAWDAPRQQGGTSTSRGWSKHGAELEDPTVREAAQEGIELKKAKANPLLGQFHLEGKGKFVRAKLGRNLEGSQRDAAGSGSHAMGQSSQPNTPAVHSDGRWPDRGSSEWSGGQREELDADGGLELESMPSDDGPLTLL